MKNSIVDIIKPLQKNLPIIIKHKWKVVLIFFTLMTIPNLFYSCESDIPELKLINVTGIIKSSTGELIPGASILIVDQEIEGGLTGNDGAFNFTELRLDDATYSLAVTHIDYEDKTGVFTIKGGELIDDIAIELTPCHIRF